LGGGFRVGHWVVEPDLNTISGKGRTHHLEPKVMEVLVCLARHPPGELLPKEKLLHEVWPKTFVTDDALTRCIFELRRVFEDQAKEPRIIQTIPKRGYRLIAPVATIKEGEDQRPSETGQITAAKITKSKIAMLAFLAIALFFLLLGAVLVGGVRERLMGKRTVLRIQSLAVLPLQNLSADPRQEYLSDAITDALITDLAQIGSLKVISRTSSMHYKQTKKTLPEIARELNVDGIVEGTVQLSGDRVRVTAQLVHASDKHLWANTYEWDLRDLFALERNVADDIAHRVQASVTRQNHAVQPHPATLEALEAYREGRYSVINGDSGPRDDNLRKAAEYFQQAIGADPTFAPAYIGLADSHLYLWWPSSEDLTIVKNSAEKAVELAPDSPDARLELGEAKFDDWDWGGAEEEYRRAIALNPNNARAHDSLGHLRDVLGEIDEAWKEHEIAQQLDANAGGNFWPREHEDYLSDALRRRGQFEKAIGLLKKMSERRPDDGVIRWYLSENFTSLNFHGQPFT